MRRGICWDRNKQIVFTAEHCIYIHSFALTRIQCGEQQTHTERASPYKHTHSHTKMDAKWKIMIKTNNKHFKYFNPLRKLRKKSFLYNVKNVNKMKKEQVEREANKKVYSRQFHNFQQNHINYSRYFRIWPKTQRYSISMHCHCTPVIRRTKCEFQICFLFRLKCACEKLISPISIALHFQLIQLLVRSFVWSVGRRKIDSFLISFNLFLENILNHNKAIKVANIHIKMCALCVCFFFLGSHSMCSVPDKMSDETGIDPHIYIFIQIGWVHFINKE